VAVPVTLYTRAVCPLCDELLDALAGLSLDVTQVDVDGDRELKKRYGMRIPVLADAEGTVLAEGRLDGESLARVRTLAEACT